MARPLIWLVDVGDTYERAVGGEYAIYRNAAGEWWAQGPGHVTLAYGVSREEARIACEAHANARAGR